MEQKNEYVKATSDIFIKYMFGMDTKQMQSGQEYLSLQLLHNCPANILPNSYRAKHPRSCKATAKVSTLTSSFIY